ncbi:glycosyltransferase family 2 protein [Alteromonas gilva]|uniref:Glycosyltransferase n=1 Tax=Alteromonas gilva TaxID=2987522 RepID=A0ABT5L0C6_9ALTE|nr:glycosyltransferase [Alteromonas gilva]MDC8830342.1 glycosyltransferase [Alteromonas gilva]
MSATSLAQIAVIIPTRDRVGLLRRAISSVLSQSLLPVEIIIVDSSTNQETLDWYQSLPKEQPTGIHFYAMSHPHGSSGYGPSTTRNFGVIKANANYVAFLDDDDEWVDNHHLARAHSLFTEVPDAEVYLSQQEVIEGNNVASPLRGRGIWLENIDLKSLNDGITQEGVFRLNSIKLLSQGNFSHLNCTIVKKSLFTAVNGFDESIRYEEDKDFYCRILNRTDWVYITEQVSSRHYIPIAKSASTSLTEKEKLLFQLQICNKSLSNDLAPTKRYKVEKSNVLKKLTHVLLSEKKTALASSFALTALATRFSFKWAAYAFFLWLRSKF